MIDFEELDAVDVNARLLDVLDGVQVPSTLAHAEQAFGEELENWCFSAPDSAIARRVLAKDAVRIFAGTTIAILVPFRDDGSGRRQQQLQMFTRHIHEAFMPQLPCGVSVELIVLEQSAQGDFNRGKLLNLGALWCRSFLEGKVLLCPHDVDMLPDPTLVPFYCHCQEGDCVHVGWVNRKYDYEGFFGGVCVIPMEEFFAAGGFPNNFWGWGREDDVFYARLRLITQTNILVPDTQVGITFIDDGPPREESANVATVRHFFGTDNIFDMSRFFVLDHDEHDWVHHLLLDLQPNRLLGGSKGRSAQVLASLFKVL